MKTPIAYLLTLLSAFALPTSRVAAEEATLAEFSWPELAKAGALPTGTVATLPDGQTALKVENTTGAPLHATVLTVENPKITSSFYMITGEVRYEGVEGDGYLEMWSHFGPGAYFSRTLGDSGPMAKLTGSAEWRTFSLPFNAAELPTHPTKLVINLQFPGKGTVFLRKLKLTQSSPTAAATGAWWSDQRAGLIGGIGGPILGLLGTLVEWLAARGRAPRFVLTTVKALIGVGAVVTLAGLAALLLRQPYAVWFVLLLCGGLLVGIFPVRLRRYQQRFRDLEWRRMSSMDAAARP